MTTRRLDMQPGLFDLLALQDLRDVARHDAAGEAFGDRRFPDSRFADQNNFQALWLPERHFTKFGCLCGFDS